MAKFDPSDIEITLQDKGFSNDITQSGVVPKKYFDITIFNGSSQSVKWIIVEVSSMFSETKRDRRVGNYVTCWMTTWGDKHKQSFGEIIPAGGSKNYTGYWHSFGRGKTLGQLQSSFSELFVYQYYGELSNGEKFSKVLRPGLSYNDNGSYYKLDYEQRYSLGCFVTTTAFGDAHHPMVESFRGLRDQILVNFKLGQRFIDWYNNNGPVLARGLECRPQLRRAARAILTPLAKTVSAARRIVDRSPQLRSYFYTAERR